MQELKSLILRENSDFFTTGFLQDIQYFLSLSNEELSRFENFINSASVEEDQNHAEFLYKELKIRNPESIQSIISMVSFFVKMHMDDREEFANFVGDLVVLEHIDKNAKKKIVDFFEALKEFEKILIERAEYETYEKGMVPCFKEISTRCSVVVQFDEALHLTDTNSDINDSLNRPVRLIPVANIKFVLEDDDLEKSIAFQVNKSDIRQIIEVLRSTGKKLEAIEEKVKIK